MTQKKPKSLGRMKSPNAHISSFNGTTGKVEIKLITRDRRIALETTPYCAVRTLMELAHSIVASQRAYAMNEWNNYKRLRDLSGYKPPEGEDPQP